MNNQDEKRINPFSDIKSMAAASLGKLPTSLVMILALSITMAALSGLILQWATPDKKEKEFLPLRLEQTDSAEPIEIKKIQGNWVLQTSNYAMTLTFIDDRFEWIVTLADIKDTQYYARGNYKVVGDVMILAQRPDLGVPYDPSKPWLKFMPIAMENINAYLKQAGKNIIWTIPLSEQTKILSRTGAIFESNPDGMFEWRRL